MGHYDECYEYDNRTLPADCEREPVKSLPAGHSLCRGDMDYINQQIAQAVEDALNALSKAMAETKSSNVDVVRNVALQLAISVHTQDDAPLRRVEIVETARAFHSFMKGWEA